MIYFHGDFDGVNSAALIARALDIKRPRFCEVNHPLDGWDKFEFIPGDIVVDFPSSLGFVPGMWWFDHHIKGYGRHSTHSIRDVLGDQWRCGDRPSCTSTIWHYFSKHKNYKDKDNNSVHMLNYFSDVIDGALYRDVEEAASVDEPEMGMAAIMHTLSEDKNVKIIRELIEIPSYSPIVTKHRKAINAHVKQRSVDFSKLKYSIHDKIIKVDATMVEEPFRYAPFKIMPKADFGIMLLKHGAAYKISIGKNPFKKIVSASNISAICDHFGGGGHLDVGSIVVKTRKEAREIVNQIVANRWLLARKGKGR